MEEAQHGPHFKICLLRLLFSLRQTQLPVSILLLQTCFSMAATEAAKAKKLRKEPVHKHAPYIEVRCILRHSEPSRCISSCSTAPLCR